MLSWNNGTVAGTAKRRTGSLPIIRVSRAGKRVFSNARSNPQPRDGIGKIGWHTFRHSYSTLLRRVGADIKVQQELLRHSTIQSTMNVYTQAMSEGKRAANSVVVRSVLPFETCGGVTAA